MADSGTGRGGVQIRSQALRGRSAMADSETVAAFTITPAAPADLTAAASEGGWCEADVRRAIAAAEQAGLSRYRIEISADGTITIVVGEPAAPE